MNHTLATRWFRIRAWLSAIAVAVLLAGCASYSGSTLVAGRSTAAEVEGLMGTPSDKLTGDAGETVWFYPRGPAGRQTFAVRIGSDGIMRGIEQRLTVANVARLLVDKSSSQDARALLGPPVSTGFFPRIQRTVWEYKMVEGENVSSTSYFKALTLEFSGDGVLRKLTLQDDFIDLGGHCMDC